MAQLFIGGDLVNVGQATGVFCHAELARIALDSDFAIINLEAPVTSAALPARKSGPVISQNPSTVAMLREQGFDCVMLANNHIMDFGTKGLGSTIAMLERHGVQWMGAGLSREDAYRPLELDIGGLRVGFVNACEYHHGALGLQDEDCPGYAWLGHPLVDRTVRELRDRCDFVVVLPHAGLENFRIPQRQWRARYRQLCEIGADLVVGAHPHVPQGMEQIGSSFIVYSTGNFFFDALGREAKPDPSLSVLVELERSSRPKVMPIYHAKLPRGVVCRVDPPVEATIESLSMMLYENYEHQHMKMQLDRFRKLKPLLVYGLAPLLARFDLKNSLRRTVSRALGRFERQDRRDLVLHLLRNESYHNVVVDSLEHFASRGSRW